MDGLKEMQHFRTVNRMVYVAENVGGAATAGCRLPIDCFEVPFTGTFVVNRVIRVNLRVSPPT